MNWKLTKVKMAREKPQLVDCRVRVTYSERFERQYHLSLTFYSSALELMGFEEGKRLAVCIDDGYIFLKLTDSLRVGFNACLRNGRIGGDFVTVRIPIDDREAGYIDSYLPIPSSGGPAGEYKLYTAEEKDVFKINLSEELK